MGLLVREKSALKESSFWTLHWSLLASVFCFFFGLLPFINARRLMDYDTSSTLGKAGSILWNGETYAPLRKPGNPAYDFIFYGLCKVLDFFQVPQPQWYLYLQTLSVFFTVGVLVLLYDDLKQHLKPLALFFALTSFSLHPLVLWHGWSAVEDMAALFFGYLSFSMVRKNQSLYWAALISALAINCKMFALAFWAASLFVLFPKSWKKVGELFTFASMSVILSVLFYMPAFLAYKMDFKTAFETLTYNTTQEQRLELGWYTIRTTLLYNIPLLFFGLYKLAIGIKKKEIGALVLSVLSLTFAGLLTYPLMGAATFKVLLTGILVCIGLRILVLKERTNFLKEAMPLLLILALSLAVFFKAPFSRSYLLFALIPLTLLLSRSIKAWPLWLTCAALSYIPMFYYYELNLKSPRVLIYDRGYYKSHLEGKANEYNDQGFTSVQPSFFLE